jgi:hypothetical protein
MARAREVGHLLPRLATWEDQRVRGFMVKALGTRIRLRFRFTVRVERKSVRNKKG